MAAQIEALARSLVGPGGAHQRLGHLARVDALVVDPLGQRPQLAHGLGNDRRDRFQRQIEREPRGVLGDAPGKRHQLVRIDERKGARERVNPAAAGPERRQAHRADTLGLHRRSQIQVSERPVARMPGPRTRWDRWCSPPRRPRSAAFRKGHPPGRKWWRRPGRLLRRTEAGGHTASVDAILLLRRWPPPMTLPHSFFLHRAPISFSSHCQPQVR